MLANCEDKANVIYWYDIASDSYLPVHDYQKNEQSWRSDYISVASPYGDRFIWGFQSYQKPEFITRRGVTWISKYEEMLSSMYWSDPSFQRALPAGDWIPRLWLPRNFGLFVNDQGEGQERRSTSYLEDMEGEYKIPLGTYKSVLYHESSISPDGRWFVLPVFQPNPEPNRTDIGAFLLIDLVKRKSTVIDQTMFGSVVTWKPDSRQFIFTGMVEDLERQVYWGGIYLFDLTTQESRLIAERSVAAWSPNGEWIAVFNNSVPRRFYLMRPDGSSDQELPLPEEWVKAKAWSSRVVRELQWTGDEKGLFLTALVNAFPTRYALMYYDLASEELSYLLEYPEKDFVSGRRMDLSPDGKWIILESVIEDPQYSIGLQSNWHVCNSEGCILITPPSTWRCFQVYWPGPYPHPRIQKGW